MTCFRYELCQRVHIAGKGERIFVVVRRRYDEGIFSAFVQYVLVNESDVGAHGRYVPHLTEYEPDVLGLEETPCPAKSTC